MIGLCEQCVDRCLALVPVGALVIDQCFIVCRLRRVVAVDDLLAGGTSIKGISIRIDGVGVIVDIPLARSTKCAVCAEDNRIDTGHNIR